MNETKEKFKGICRKIRNAFTYLPKPDVLHPRSGGKYPVSVTYVALPGFAVNFAVPSPCTSPPRLQTSSHKKERDKGVHGGAVALVLRWRMMMAPVAAEPQNSREAEVEEMCR